jgi:hypothetical protein
VVRAAHRWRPSTCTIADGDAAGAAIKQLYSPGVTEGFRTTLVAFAAVGLGLTWQAVRTSMIPASSPDRLVSELRLAQVIALLLAMSAGAYVGLAVAHEAQLGVGFDVALAIGFFVVAAATLVRDPHQALTMLAFGFAAHAVLDVAHRPGWPLPDEMAPRWYSIGCAVFDVYIGALCYLPILRR